MNQAEIMRVQFREAMSRLSAAVNVITSCGESGRCGITATAVCSVSDAPPSVLICLNRSSALNPVFQQNGVVCINVLAADQEEQARHFAGMTGIPMDERFSDVHWQVDENGAPVLRNALANLHGRIVQTQEVGSHTVMIVELGKIGLSEQHGDSLVYFNRHFHRLASTAMSNAETMRGTP